MTRYCEWCDARLPDDARSHKRYCSDSHRTRASEARRMMHGNREYARFYAFLMQHGTPEQIEAWRAMTSTPELDATMTAAFAAMFREAED